MKTRGPVKGALVACTCISHIREMTSACPRYPFMATEVLCSDIWSIVESCVAHSEQLLTPFWETVLETSPDAFKEPMLTAMATFFAKVNAVFLTKKPAEVNRALELCSAYTVINTAHVP